MFALRFVLVHVHRRCHACRRSQPLTAIAVLGALLAFTSPAAAQFRSTRAVLQANSPFMGGVPNVCTRTITLTVADAIFRALDHLGVLMSEQNTETAQ